MKILLSLLVTTLLFSCKVGHCDYANYTEAFQAGADELQAGNYEESYTAFQLALSLAQDDQQKADAYNVLGSNLIIQRKFAQARVQFGKVLVLPKAQIPAKVTAQIRVGDSFLCEGNYPNARIEYNKALQTNGIAPTSAFVARLNLAQTFILGKDFKTARAEFSKLLLLKTSLPYIEVVVQLNIGRTYTAESNFDKDRETFNTVLGFKSVGLSIGSQDVVRANQQSAQIAVADTYLFQQEYPEAKREYEKALAMDKIDPVRKSIIQSKLKTLAQLIAAGIQKN
jgi:tetratricopeptide (TPR) repeat protein